MYMYIVIPQDVDQHSGEDLNPVVNKMLAGGEVKDAKARNPDRYMHIVDLSQNPAQLVHV